MSKYHNQAKISTTLDYLLKGEKHNEHVEFAECYGEPGYTDPASNRGILLANWNHFPRGLQSWLEDCGFELEWSDEWVVTYHSGKAKAWRTEPDCYSWQPSIVWDASYGEYLTRDDDPADIIDALQSEHPQDVNGILPDWITQQDLMDAGYEMLSGDLESGWHHGQTDDPHKIQKEAFNNPKCSSVVFRKTENSQFYIKFECWVRLDAWTDGEESTDDNEGG
jgi:hypothetical protein